MSEKCRENFVEVIRGILQNVNSEALEGIIDELKSRNILDNESNLNDFTNVETELSVANETIMDMQRKIEVILKANKSLKDENVLLTKQNDILNSENIVLRQQRNEATNVLAVQSEELDTLKKTKEEQKVILESLSNQILNDNLNKMSKTLTNLDCDINDILTRIEKLESKPPCHCQG